VSHVSCFKLILGRKALLVSSVISLNIHTGCELSHDSVQALGCLQTIVEASLLNTVTVVEQITDENSTISNQGFIVPFFGKSRWIRSTVMLNESGYAVDTSIAALEDINSILSAAIHLTYCLCQYSGREQTFFAGGVIRFFALCIAGPKPLDDLFRMLQPIEVTKLLWACAKAISPQSTSYSSASREASNAVGRKLLHELIRKKNKGEEKGDLLESFFTTLDASYQCKFLWSLSKLYGKEIQQERSNGKQLSLYCGRLWEEKNEVIALSDLSNLVSECSSRSSSFEIQRIHFNALPFLRGRLYHLYLFKVMGHVSSRNVDTSKNIRLQGLVVNY
jgi:hypothetical protein